MKSAFITINLLSAAFLLLFSASALALPSVGDKVTITGGALQSGSGGQFNLDIGSNNTIDYFSFCVEYNEHITLPGTYTIQSIEDYASNGGVSGQTETNKDYLSEATKKVMWDYYTSTDSKSALRAGTYQNLIWYLEGEIASITGDALALYDNTYAAYYNNQTYIFKEGIVKVLNLVSGTNGATNNQSQMIAEYAPVPEPATMLLFGTGLVGLAGIARRRQANG